jgi:hypothetical protein
MSNWIHPGIPDAAFEHLSEEIHLLTHGRQPEPVATAA